MRVLPVLDVQGGVVVHGVAGRRHEYRPVRSVLTPSCDPLDVAGAFRSHFGLTALYLADLDAIAGGTPDRATCAALQADGWRVWVDAGVTGPDRAAALAGLGLDVVVGLETVAGPAALGEMVRLLGERVVFSLDLRDGQPLGDRAAWGGADAWILAGQALDLGVRRLLVLDLARVGVGTGTGTENLCARLAAAYPDVEVGAGGGVQGPEDLDRLRGLGLAFVLVASALHDGRLRREHLTAYAGRHS